MYAYAKGASHLKVLFLSHHFHVSWSISLLIMSKKGHDYLSMATHAHDGLVQPGLLFLFFIFYNWVHPYWLYLKKISLRAPLVTIRFMRVSIILSQDTTLSHLITRHPIDEFLTNSLKKKGIFMSNPLAPYPRWNPLSSWISSCCQTCPNKGKFLLPAPLHVKVQLYGASLDPPLISVAPS